MAMGDRRAGLMERILNFYEFGGKEGAGLRTPYTRVNYEYGISNGVRVKHDDIMGAGAKTNSENIVGGNIAKVSGKIFWLGGQTRSNADVFRCYNDDSLSALVLLAESPIVWNGIIPTYWLQENMSEILLEKQGGRYVLPEEDWEFDNASFFPSCEHVDMEWVPPYEMERKVSEICEIWMITKLLAPRT